MKRNAKRRKSEKRTDYMSSLSDDLLLYILSFLSTTDSVATCVLSRRWRHLWKHTEVLNFDDDPWSDLSPCKTPAIDFIEFVKEVLNRREQHVQKFYLFCRATIIDPEREVATWIRKVLGPHLQEISITLSSSSLCLFPSCILRCESLVSLHLQCREMHVDEKICNNVYDLPSLKKLVLKIGSARCIMSLLSCCPNLETLELEFHLGIIRTMNISMLPSLKSLTLLGLGYMVRILTIINTPLLEYLNINLQSTMCNALSLTSNLHNLLHVHLNILHRVRGVVQLLSKIYMAQALTLNVSTIKYFREAWRVELPEFHRLVRLELIVNYLDSSFVMDLLQHCCVLEFLHIHSLKLKYWKKKRKRSRALPSVAPSCVESHLKDVEFRGYCDTKEEHAFVAYILERGLVLKNMKIFHGLKKSSEEDIRKQRQQILNALSTLPTTSNTC